MNALAADLAELSELLKVGRAWTAARRAERLVAELGDTVHPSLVYHHALALGELGADEAAYHLLADLLEGDPGNLRARQRFALAADQTGRVDEAEAAYRTLLANRPTNSLARWRLGWLWLREGEPAAAVKVLGPIASEPNGCWLLGRALALHGLAADEYPGPPADVLARLDDPRAVVVCSEPKSGTNWLRLLLANYLRLLADPGASAPVPSAELQAAGFVANDRWRCLTGLDPVVAPHPILAELGVPEVSFQHLNQREDTLWGSTARVVLLHRHALDQVVSRFHYFYADRADEHRRDSLGAVDAIGQVLERELLAIARTRRRLLTAATDPRVVDIVAYVELRDDAVARLRGLLGALALPIDDAAIETAVGFAAPDVVRAQELADGPLYPHLTRPFARDGRVGQWQEALDADQQAFCTEVFDALGLPLDATEACRATR